MNAEGNGRLRNYHSKRNHSATIGYGNLLALADAQSLRVSIF
jgi:hypothetical protein